MHAFCLRSGRTSGAILKCCSSTHLRHVSDKTSDFLTPTWSIKELLQSYPAPKVDDNTLHRLHTLAALKPPEIGSAEYESLRKELEGMIRLVDAVKTIHVPDMPVDATLDGRIWPDSEGLQFEDDAVDPERVEESRGRALLKHSSTANDEYYLVESSKR